MSGRHSASAAAVRLTEQRLPELRGRLPAAGLGSYPSPVERLRAVERAAGLVPGTELWIKRDDLAGAPLGLAKVRKLEQLLGAALAVGAREVVTLGPLGSNHALATALAARRLGLRARLLLWPEAVTPRVELLLRAMHALGARLELLGELGEHALLEQSARRGVRAWSAPAPQSFFLPPAGTDAVGASGYVECALELEEARAQGVLPVPDFVHVAGGTGGVAAGLAVGLALAGPPLANAQVVAVRAVGEGVLGLGRLVLWARRIQARLEALGAPRAAFGGRALQPRAFRILHGHAGGGYAVPTAEAEAAAALFARAAGIALDPVYTAKAAAGLLAFARSAEGRGRRHLFVHTHAEPDLGALAAGAAAAALPPPFGALLAGR
ncbi:MAG: 1-aminocyclopropane-1-carboxylate deaminase [Planctomycetota bacterium]|nr:MAG: 1-aminocyclopropane-1-carboxylate deaminase [Planctomycetota bacterium]